MLKIDYTSEAKEVVGPFVRRAGKTFLVVRCGDVFGQEQSLRITPDAVADFYATQAGNLLSGCRTLAGLTGDWRAVSELAKAALEWFKKVNVTGMRRAARRLGLFPPVLIGGETSTMTTTTRIDWTDVDEAARLLAGNWRRFDSFAWQRAYDLEDADRWMIWYTSSRDACLLERSNEAAINKRLEPFSKGDDPDLVFERHSHWAVGHLEGFSVRVFRDDGRITDAFEEFCRIKERLEDYSILDEHDYSEREYQATLANYRSEMWRLKDDLPDGWESEVYSWFSDHGHDRYIENRDDQGGYAPREKIIEALQDLGLLPTVVVSK